MTRYRAVTVPFGREVVPPDTYRQVLAAARAEAFNIASRLMIVNSETGEAEMIVNPDGSIESPGKR